MAKGYKRYTLGQAMKIIEQGGLRNMSANELRSVGRPIMTETRSKMKELRQAGYTKVSPAYIAYKNLGLKTTTSSENRNMLLTEVYNAYKFLMAKTSSVNGVENYFVKVSTLFGRSLSMEEVNLVWSAMDKLRKEYPNIFEDFSYNTVIEEVAVQAQGKDDSREVMENVKNILSLNSGEVDVQDPFDDSEQDEFWL